MPRVSLRSDDRAANQPFPVDFLRSNQFSFVLKASPYYREAKQSSQLSVFLDSFFELWFMMYPEKAVDTADYKTALERITQTRQTVIFNLAMTSVFYTEVEKSWEEFRAETVADFMEKKSRVIERDHKGCPRPFRKVKRNAPSRSDPEYIIVPDSDGQDGHTTLAQPAPVLAPVLAANPAPAPVPEPALAAKPAPKKAAAAAQPTKKPAVKKLGAVQHAKKPIRYISVHTTDDEQDEGNKTGSAGGNGGGVGDAKKFV